MIEKKYRGNLDNMINLNNAVYEKLKKDFKMKGIRIKKTCYLGAYFTLYMDNLAALYAHNNK